MNASAAIRIIECFRMGVPPDVLVEEFTVEPVSYQELAGLLEHSGPSAVLFQANSGSGKTHMLRLLKRMALQKGLAVSMVSLDSSAEVRFNRMDQFLGACLRNFEIPGSPSSGVRGLMDFLSDRIATSWNKSAPGFWRELTNGWKWDCTDLLESPSLYIALRAWCFGDADARAFIENWLGYPWNHYRNRVEIHRKLVADLKQHFVDPRPQSYFYSMREYVFHFQDPQYVQSWAALRDVTLLLHHAGITDWVLLFDEVDEILTGLGNLRFQKIALRNLLRFFDGADFPGTSVFAVSPEFKQDCRTLLQRRQSWSEEFCGLTGLPSVDHTALGRQELHTLGQMIVQAHGIAYGWENRLGTAPQRVNWAVEGISAPTIGDGTRQAVMAIVEALDQALETAT